LIAVSALAAPVSIAARSIAEARLAARIALIILGPGRSMRISAAA
jgi:hypothetical protein